jgi:hypothetical protein
MICVVHLGKLPAILLRRNTDFLRSQTVFNSNLTKNMMR